MLNGTGKDYLFSDHQYNILLQITDQLASLIVAQLLFLQSDDPKKPIQMYLNSPGLLDNA